MLKYAIVKKAKEMRGRGDHQAGRHDDVIMVLDYYRPRKLMLMDGAITSVYRNNCLRAKTTTPGYATKHAEDRKLYADKALASPASSIRGGLHDS